MGQSCGNDKQSPSKWVVARGPFVWKYTLSLSPWIRRRGRERYLQRETFRLPLLLCCRILRMFGGKSDGYWICAELDMSNKCDRVFPSTPHGRCVTGPPKTDKHGIHQGSGKHVTSSTLHSYSVTLEVVESQVGGRTQSVSCCMTERGIFA